MVKDKEVEWKRENENIIFLIFLDNEVRGFFFGIYFVVINIFSIRKYFI